MKRLSTMVAMVLALGTLAVLTGCGKHGGITNPEPPATPTPTFTLTVMKDGTGAGSTDPALGNHTYNSGTAVTIAATPVSGSVLDHWSPSGSTSSSVSVTMDGDRIVTAVFRKLLPDLTPLNSVNPPTLAVAVVPGWPMTGSAGLINIANRGEWLVSGRVVVDMGLRNDASGAHYPMYTWSNFNNGVTWQAGQTLASPAFATAVPKVPSGTYHLFVRVDPSNQFAETNEGNNESIGTKAMVVVNPTTATAQPANPGELKLESESVPPSSK